MRLSNWAVTYEADGMILMRRQQRECVCTHARVCVCVSERERERQSERMREEGEDSLA